MKMKSLLMAGTLALASLSIASAKSYDIVLTSPVSAGNTQLKAGEYSLKVEGEQAVFTDVETGKKFTAPVKLENGSKKFELTAVGTTNQNGSDRIQTIELGGSSTELVFGE